MSRNHYRGYTVLVALVLVWVAAGLLGAQAGWKGRGLWASSGRTRPPGNARLTAERQLESVVRRRRSKW